MHRRRAWCAQAACALAACALAACALAACGGAGVRSQPPPGPEAIAGVWTIADGSDVVVRVTLDGAQPRLEAQDFEVTSATLEGRRLRATFRYLPNGVTTTSDLTLVSASRLEGSVSGAYSGRETWLRVEPDAGPLLPFQPPAAAPAP